jgi:hypothetical protein
MLEANKDFQAVNTAFPHIGQRLRAAWGKPLFRAVMDELLHDTRGGTRRGFPMGILLALQNLNETHKRLHPDLHPRDIWDNQ